MSTQKKLYECPVASTSFSKDAHYHMAHPMSIRYEFRINGIEHRAGLRFKRTRAIRTRSEGYCTPWHIDEAYDTLVEVTQSDWLAAFEKEVEDGRNKRGEVWKMRHFLIYLDSVGSFECIAESWEEIVPEPGEW